MPSVAKINVDANVLQLRQCVHVKLEKGIHASLRARLFRDKLSIQEVVNEFALQLSVNDEKACSVVKRLLDRKARDSINSKRMNKKKKGKIKPDELDHDALYDLIEKKVGDVNELV